METSVKQRRDDGSFVVDGYHVPNFGEWSTRWLELNDMWEKNPNKFEQIEPEPLPIEPTIEGSRASAMTDIAARRWQAETSGIVVIGMPIPTDRESQGLITGAAAGCLIDPSQVVMWKTGATDQYGAPVFIELGADAIKFVALSVRSYVQACFDVEAVKCAAVSMLKTTDDINDWLQVSLDTDWPARERTE